MLDQILPMAKEVCCVTPDNPRALDAAELAGIIEQKGVKATPFDSIGEAVESVIQKAKEAETSAVALGSLYMIGDIKSYIKNR
jgi:dihydrofolate synthase/folylpolyglutamate synthase